MQIFDAHAHLQDEKLFSRLEDIVPAARLIGVEKIVCCGTSEADWDDVAKVKRKYPNLVIASFGLHPWYLKLRTSAWFDVLKTHLIKIPSVIGEIGLDFVLTDLDQEEQKDIFSQQLQLAQELKRPVSIHCRRAWEELLSVLAAHGVLKAGGVIHSYSGNVDLIPQLVKYNLFFSFSGSITFSGNKRVHKTLRAVPPERLLIETDSPDLLPLGAAEPNVPANIRMVVLAAAKELGLSEEKIAQSTFANALKVFKAYE